MTREERVSLAFVKGISGKWVLNSLIQVINTGYHNHFLQW